MNLKQLTKHELLASSKAAVETERQSTIRVLHHLREIERRRLYSEKGFSSLFEMCVQHFGYSAAGAQRRISSMRLMREMPEIEKKIESGELSLTAAANVQTFFREKKYNADQKTQVIASCLNKTSRQVDKQLASLQPRDDKRESIRFSKEDRLRLSLNISEELYEKLEKVKHLHRLKTVEDVINYLADRELEADKRKSLVKVNASTANEVAPLNKVPTAVSLPAPEVTTRYIPKATKRIVVKRNQEKRCEYMDPITQKRCEEKHHLQFDHIHPYSKGGSHLTENLRQLCGHHNRYLWHHEQK